MPPKNKGGRPRKKIDWDQLVELCKLQCTRDECAAVLNISDDALVAAIKRKGWDGFAAYFKENCGAGKASLRRMQWKAAQQGNIGMLIWLGKQYLGQRDHRLEEISAEVTQRTGVLVVPGIMNKEAWQEAADASVETK